MSPRIQNSDGSSRVFQYGQLSQYGYVGPLTRVPASHSISAATRPSPWQAMSKPPCESTLHAQSVDLDCLQPLNSFVTAYVTSSESVAVATIAAAAAKEPPN